MSVDQLPAPPVVHDRYATVPVLRRAACLWDIIFDPVGMAERLAQRHDDVFTLRIPFAFDLTYLVGLDGYRTMTTLPPSQASIGPVMSNVPAIGFWFPRAGKGPDSLQDLILTGRRLIASLLTRPRLDELTAIAGEVTQRRVAGWTPTTDLAVEIPRAVYESSIRCLAGDALWDTAGEQLVPLLRAIANGIDIPRAALARTPLHVLMPEYRATRRQASVLRQTYARLRGRGNSPAVEAIERAGLAPADQMWMLMYVLWNATAYPGGYTLWTLLDILERPHLLARLRATTDPAERQRLLGFCLAETIRRHPVSSLVRHLSEPLTYERNGRRWRIPAGGYVGTLPGLINRDPNRFDRPDEYDPDRHAASDTAQPASFGRGGFGCVAAEYSRVLTAVTHDTILQTVDLDLVQPTPTRQVRVHLTYPDHPIPATVTPAPTVRDSTMDVLSAAARRRRQTW